MKVDLVEILIGHLTQRVGCAILRMRDRHFARAARGRYEPNQSDSNPFAIQQAILSPKQFCLYL
jgi:hypothetical protein